METGPGCYKRTLAALSCYVLDLGNFTLQQSQPTFPEGEIRFPDLLVCILKAFSLVNFFPGHVALACLLAQYQPSSTHFFLPFT